MTEQKLKLNKLCLTGFIFSILPLVILGAGFCIYKLTENVDSASYYSVLAIAIVLAPLIFLILSIAGLAVSIAGVITSRRDGEKGVGFGIAGITLPGLYLVTAIVLIVLFVGSIINDRAQTSQDRKRSDIYNMGSVWKTENIEYDVSQYKIPEGYELDSQDISVSESELKTFAESRLDTITKETGFYIKGTCEKSTFIIIRRDCFDMWDEEEPIGSISYRPDGYAHISYEYEWEFSATRPCTLDMYKDPSEKFIIITNCGDYKVISEFFE